MHSPYSPSLFLIVCDKFLTCYLFILLTFPSFLLLSSVSSSVSEDFLEDRILCSSSWPSVLVKWSPLPEALFTCLCWLPIYAVPMIFYALYWADVAVIELLTIMSPCFTLLLKLYILEIYVVLALQYSCALLFLPQFVHACFIYHLTLLKMESNFSLYCFSRYLQWSAYSSTLQLERKWSKDVFQDSI